MAAFGPEIADAYIEVHADTAKFRRELRQRLVKDMQGFAKKAQKTFGDYLNMDKAADWDSFHRNLARAVRTGDFSRLRKEFADTGDWVGEVTKRVHALRDAVITMQNAEGEIETKPIFSEKDIDRIRKSLGLYVQELEQAGGRDVRRFYTKLADRYEEDYKKFSDTQRRKRLQVEKFYTDLANRYEADFERLRESHRRQEITTAEFYRRLGNRYEADATKFAAEQERKQETFDRMNRLHATALRERTKAEQDAAAEIVLARQRILDQLAFEARAEKFDTVRLQQLRKEIADELRAATEDQRRELGVRESDWDRHVAKLRSTLLTFYTTERVVSARADREAQAAVLRQRRRYSVFFDGMRNSRSEFIHAVAVMLDSVATLTGRTFDGIVDLFRRIRSEGFSGVISDLGRGVASLAQNWQAVLVSIGAIASSMALMGALSGMLISLASGLSAILVGIVSSLGMALLAIVPMAGALGGAAYGAGLLVGAFRDMDRYLPGVSEALEELRRVFSDVDVPAFAAGVAGPLKGLFADLSASLEGDKVAGALGKAFGSIITSLNEVVKSPGWTSFMHALETSIPGALAGLGRGFGGVIEGLMSSFGAGGPAVERIGKAFGAFGDSFAKTMDEMDKSGRLDEFFDLAADSLIVVSDLIWSVGKALVGLFEAAGPAGNDLLRSITGLVDKFTVWVTSAEGKNQIAEWMEFGREVAVKLWDIIVQVGDELKRLDTPQNRKWALSLLNLIRGIVHGVGTFIEIAGKLAAAYETINQSVVGFFQGAGDWFGSVGEALSGVWGAIKEFWDGLDWGQIGSGVREGVTGVFGAVGGWVTETLSTAWAGVTTWFTQAIAGLWGHVSAVLQTTLASPWGQFWTGMVGLAGAILGGITSVVRLAVEGVVGVVRAVFGGVFTTVTEMGGRLLRGVEKTWSSVASVVTDAVQGVRNTVSAAWTATSQAVSKAVSTILASVTTGWGSVKATTVRAWNDVKAAVADRIGAVASTLAGAISRITAPMVSAWNAVKTIVSNAMRDVVRRVSSGITDVVITLLGLPSRAARAVGDLSGTLTRAGRSLIEGLIRGINSSFDRVRRVLSSLTSLLPKWKGPETRDRSILFSVGKMVIGGFIKGMESEYSHAQRSLSRFTRTLSADGFGLAPGVAYGGTAKTLNVAPGAIQINTRTTDPRLAAGMVLDGLASKMMGV